MDIRASGYFSPRLLEAHLQPLLLLEDLTLGFSVPVPHPSTESELLGAQGTPVMLPNMISLRFQGVGAYLECLVDQIRVPLLERQDIMLFNQITFGLPHLSHLINTTEAFKLPTSMVFFGNEDFIIMDHQPYGHLTLRVLCMELDWQSTASANKIKIHMHLQNLKVITYIIMACKLIL